MMRTWRIALAGMILPLLVVLSIGCGGSSSTPGKLTGSVTLDNAAITGGIVYIHTKGGATAHAPISLSGTYTATDLPVGEWKVTVDTESLNPDQKAKSKGQYGKKGAMGPTPQGAKTEKLGTYVAIPKIYQDEKTTPLVANVTAGTSTFNISMKSN
jgi:hypothetical protein